MAECSGDEVESSETKTIDDLPNELLSHVFSFLDVKDIVLGVRQVCKRWSLVGDDNSLWNTRQLCMMSCNHRDVLTLSMASSKLRWINIPYHKSLKEDVLKDVLNIVAEHCPLLKGIKVSVWESKCYSALQLVLQQCVKLEKVEIRFWIAPWNNLNMLGSCKNLKELRLFFRTTEHSIFSAIVKGCPHLQSLDLQMSSFNHRDLSCLLKKFGNQLQELSYSCCTRDDHEYCIITDIVRFCKSLKVLKIREHTGPTHKLQEFLVSGAADNLQKLELDRFDDIDTALFVAIFRHSRNLTSLKLEELQLVDDYMKYVGELTNLRTLEILGENALTDQAVTDIVQCKKLTKLVLSPCSTQTLRFPRRHTALTDQSFMLCCLELPNLQELCLETAAVNVESLLLVPTHLKNLQHLHVYGKHLNEGVEPVKACMPDLEIAVVWEGALYRRT